MNDKKSFAAKGSRATDTQSSQAADAQPGRADGCRSVIVGIGASAGGLESLKAFFSQVPADPGMSFVVVVHLSPDQKSLLAELLQPHTKLPIRQVTETTAIEPDHVYVIPPNANLDAIDTHLRLSELEESRRERAPINHFFRTLADMHDGDAIGIILSGTGSDGTLGLRHIKDEGGLVIVQSPDDAQYDGMPRSAIGTGMVDLVLPVAEMPARILKLVEQRVTSLIPIEGEEDTSGDQPRLLLEILAQVRARTGHDFSRYKRSTITRRIQRRMQLRHLSNWQSYLDLLHAEHNECVALLNDMLITVTEFFRDPDVFELIESKLLPEIFQGKTSNDKVRVWSVGCSTGEEAYSIAMLLLEEAGRHSDPPQLQVFASDLHVHALERAREGVYPAEIAADVPPERLARFFKLENGRYRVRHALRELVVFAPHDLLRDPPFSHMDMIVCRNLLIYLQRDVQQDVMSLFHYALKQDGLLVLGPSETIERADMFACENKSSCVYRKRNLPPREPRLPMFPLTTGGARGIDVKPPSERQTQMSYGSIHQHTVERYAPPSVLIDAENVVVHSSVHAGRYLRMPGGEPSTNLFKLVDETLRIELRAAVHAARESKQAVRTWPLPMMIESRHVRLVLRVQPALDPDLEGFLLIIFDEFAEKASASGEEESGSEAESTVETVRELEAELDLYRKRLQAMIEEYDSSREEMQASNEELQSANEELRSTLEELETSKEELQSMNEELSTVNQENRHRVEELSLLSSDLQNLMAATAVPTLFLDRDMRIVRFTPQVSELFNIQHADRGRPLSDLTHCLDYENLQDDAQQVLAKLAPIEREVSAEDGRWYLARLLPYRTADDRINGVVITLVDITETRKAVDSLQEREARYRTLAEMSPEAVLVKAEGKYVFANNAAASLFGASSPEAVVGRRPADFISPGEFKPLGKQIQQVYETWRSSDVAQCSWTRGDGAEVTVEALAGPIEWGEKPAVQLLMRDVTNRRNAEAALRMSEDRYRSLFESIDEGFCIVQMHFDEQDKPIDYSFVETNPAFERHTGMTDVIGRRMRDIAPDHEQHWFDRYGRIALSGEPERFEEPAAALGRFFEVYGFTIGSPQEHKVAVLFSDITQRKQTERQLDQTREHLEEAVVQRTSELEAQKKRLQGLAHQLASAEQRERKRLAAILHDELQQYLVAVKMRLTAAKRMAESEKVAETLEECEQLSDQAMASSRDLTRQLRPPVLFEDGLVAALRWLAGEMYSRHGLHVSVESPDSEPLLDEDVRSMLFESVRELLLNIIKHAETEAAELIVKCEQGRLTLITRDQGVGCDLASLESKGQDGESFGLFSVGERIEAIGGTFKVQSAPGDGTTVTLDVPISERDVGEESEGKSQARIGRRKSKRRRKRARKGAGISVLVVDDHAIVRQGIVNLIDSDSRLDVIGESSGADEALADIERLQPEIVIMDINLREMSGIEATRQIVARWPHIIVVGLSVQDDRATRNSMLHAGAKGFISKSDPVDVMVETIVETRNAKA